MSKETTADTITDEQIRELQAGMRGDLAKLANDPKFWTTHIHKALTEIEWALSVGDPFRRYTARARCAEILNEGAKIRCPAREHAKHVGDVCEGQCCTSCGGPIDKNEECRC